jgi:hypothetical protein
MIHRKKYVTTAAILGTAILLTCLGIVFDAIVRTGSPASLLVWSVPLALSVVAVLTVFHWVLERWVDSESAGHSSDVVQQKTAQYSKTQLSRRAVVRTEGHAAGIRF